MNIYGISVKNWLFFLAVFFWLPSVVLAQESSCITCHDPQQGRLGEPVDLWRGSVHDRNRVACSDCHGGDPTIMAMEAMSPQEGFVGVPKDSEIPDFCGRCHVGVKEDYLESAHGQALGRGGPQCVTCHRAHDVRIATLELINPQDCTRCHEYGRAEEMKGAMSDTDGLINDINQRLAELHRFGIATRTLENQVFSVRNEFHRLFHSVDVQKVKSQNSHFQEELQNIENEVENIEHNLAKRQWAGGVVVGLLLLLAVVLWLIRQTYTDARP